MRSLLALANIFGKQMEREFFLIGKLGSFCFNFFPLLSTGVETSMETIVSQKKKGAVGDGC
jgi:hypothetical protein